jgi:uncharacterized protein (UPF0333 family)
MDNKGQAILSEYVMIFFVVVAALVAMVTFIQRGFEARIHDARNFMVDAVVNSGACDVNCLKATGAAGSKIPYEYEPYYAQILSDVGNNKQENTGATTGNPQVLGAIYTKSVNEATTTISTSSQLPPECAGANPPSYCGNL